MEEESSSSASTSPLLLLCVILSLTLLFLLRYRSHGRRGGKARLPPGPPALLFLAKFLALRRSIFDLGPLLRDLHARHGPVISVHLFRTLVFVADRRVAHRVLVQGGATFADRPPALRRAMFELLMYMSLGARLGPAALDEVQELQLRILRSITSFPVFSFFPAITKRLFRERWADYVAMRRRQDEIFLPLIHARRHRDASPGDQTPCYADSLLALRVAEEGGRQLTDGEVVSLCSEFLNGGTDTTVTALEWIMAELVNRPDMQRKVYDEVKSKPELNAGDVQAMPYLKAVVLEGLRLHPPGHFLLPHGVQSDDAEISGYTVPRGAEVNFLVADMGRDETAWTAAREFRPERFVDGGEGHGVDVTGSREIKMMPFGAGRRMCPGYTLGMLHLEYFVGSLVRELDWLPASEELDMTEELDFTTVMKHPLRARIIPRTT